MKKNEFQKLYGLELKKDIMQHKEKLESIFRVKLNDEKVKIMRQKMNEVEDLVRENKKLKEEVLRVREAMREKNK